jgi:hypothetical protein
MKQASVKIKIILSIMFVATAYCGYNIYQHFSPIGKFLNNTIYLGNNSFNLDNSSQEMDFFNGFSGYIKPFTKDTVYKLCQWSKFEEL